MCGIAGFLQVNGVCAEKGAAIGKKMAHSLSHRGPDSYGVWCDDSNGVVFAHSRLSIVELSNSGHQPMVSQSGRYVITFNGEIYNHIELRRQIMSHGHEIGWKGHSDTETLLVAIEVWGVKKAIQLCVGMFAFAVWDRQSKSLVLARDRIGEKPLYYGVTDTTLFFASELKCFKHHPDIKLEVDQEALCLYLRHNYVPAPFSIYKNVFKLPPGNIVELTKTNKPISYWRLEEKIEKSYSPQHTSDEDLINSLEKLLLNSVELQMQADVSVGAFLSGGVDSSLIVSMMQEISSKRVNSFSIGFENSNFNEAPFAKKVAASIGTDHNETYVSSKDALDIIPSIPSVYDEPFSDSSQIPTMLVSKIAKEKVSVCLSGDGGDELFSGYNRYNLVSNISKNLKIFPKFATNLAKSAIEFIPPEKIDSGFKVVQSVVPGKYRYTDVGDKLHKFAALLDCQSEDKLYQHLISHWKNPTQIVKNGLEKFSVTDVLKKDIGILSFTEKMMVCDTLYYLPDDIMVKVDRASMGVSLETRSPFLDHRVVEYAWSMPLHLKLNKTETKACLRNILYKRVPRSLIERPKMGFGVPIGEWLRGPLRDWAEAYLDKGRLQSSGYFEEAQISDMWKQHISGRRNWQYHIWDVLMFETWRESVGL